MRISWVSCQPFAQSVRSSLASVNPKPHADGIGNSNKSLCTTLLGFGTSTIHSCFGRFPNIPRDSLDERRRHYLTLIQNKTPVFEHQGDRWKPSKLRSKRHMSTMIFDKSVKEVLPNNNSEMVHRTRYSSPTRLLVVWTPGSGKFSFFFRCRAIQFGHVYPYCLRPRLCSPRSLSIVVLLEDVDAASSKRTKDINLGQKPADTTASLSALLNFSMSSTVIGSPEGQVLIMTTNRIECLDDAPIHPSRADMKIEFRLADEEEMMSRLFCFIYDPKLGKAADETSVIEDEEIPRLAREFAANVPRLEFSPAEITFVGEQAITSTSNW
ncbi:mitochondrial chaperone bcs1 [Trichoderma austrokoningii]